jgi:23S rRNA pseudouridine1911/1915/1917 synthase
MDSPEPLVLYEDNHLLVLAKPAGLCSAQASAEQPSAHAWASGYLKRKYAKPGNVFVGVVHRLDRATSGVLVFARTSKAAARLSSQWRAGHIQKTYWAVVPAPLRLPDPCLLRDYLTEADGRPAIVPAPMPDDSPPRRGGGGSRSGSGPLRLALTRLTRLRERGGWVLLALEPSTGRKHQLRLQLATRGYPIVGDRLLWLDLCVRPAPGPSHRPARPHAALPTPHPLRHADLYRAAAAAVARAVR